jgi:uncharacterized protein (TIGR03437 family)
VSMIQNAASYTNGVVSPGLIVALTGSNLGPADGVSLQLASDGQSITKSLGGVQVLFDGKPAPLTYASARQVNAIVPYAVAGNDSTSVQVQYQNVTSAATTVPVQAAAPGIFTLDASGQGAGAILNADLTVNAASNRAARGSVVAIYCNGGGVTDPASVDGAVTGLPLPMLTLPVAVTIGGIDAKVSYQGGTPGAVAGLTQINAEVPAGVTPGPAVPVTVQIGDWKSQPGVTIAVK